jgi:hypothetical protein
VISAQGDGWVRGYEALTGKLWEFDTNPKDAVWPKTRNETIGAGHLRRQDLHRQRPGPGARRGRRPPLRSATKRGDIATTPRLALRQDPPVVSTARSSTGCCTPDFSGFTCRREPARIGPHTFAAVWIDTRRRQPGLPRRQGGGVVVLQTGKVKKVLPR